MYKNYNLICYTLKDHGQKLLDEKKQMVFSLLIEREKEIDFNPNIIIDYPNVEIFISNPTFYIEEFLKKAKIFNSPIVILTTYGDKLYDTLTSSGYNYEEIHMNAGPDNTCVFRKNIGNIGKTIYLELVNEKDFKIRPSFVIHLVDEKGHFCGGLCSSLSKKGKEKNVYLSTMAIKKDADKGAGTDLLNFAMNYWSKEGVSRINLGTQTAKEFYRKYGFHITNKILSDLRIRIDSHGNKVFEDLVMMEIKLKG